MHIIKKPKLKLFVDQAHHFLKWEIPYFLKHFELVQEPGEDVILFAFGPDVLEKASTVPACFRAIMLFPGYSLNPYHDLKYRQEALNLIETHYDIAFMNPGPLEVAYASTSKQCLCPFSMNTELVQCTRYRTSLNSLVHISNPSPQKDWPRSQEIMKKTGLKYEVFPPRTKHGPKFKNTVRAKAFINKVFKKLGVNFHLPMTNLEAAGYVDHQDVIQKYQQYDGFVHVASDVKHPTLIDGKYTACALEAGLTGALIFWHDTLGLGNDFETVFNLPIEPELAAQKILEIKASIRLPEHSKRTREEILDKCNAEKSVEFRCQKIKELIY